MSQWQKLLEDFSGRREPLKWNWHRKIKLFNKIQLALGQIVRDHFKGQNVTDFKFFWFNILICWTTRMVQVRFNNAAKRFVSWLWVMSSPKHQLLKSLTFGIFRATQRELCRWYHHPKPGVFHIGDVKIRGSWSELCSGVHCVAERGQHRQHRQLQNRRESLRNPSLMVVYDKAATLIKGDSRWPFKVNSNHSNRCLLEFCATMHDSVCATAKAVAARRICSFSSGAACAVHLQTSHEQEAYWKNIGNTTCTSCEFLWYCMHLYAIPHHSSVELVIPAAPALEFLSCSASCWLRALHDPKKEAQSCWECLKQLATTPSLSCICGFHNGYLGVQWKTTPKEDRLEDVQKWFDFESPIWPIYAAGCYFGSCHGAKIEPHRCPSSWIQSYMGRFQMPRKQVLSFSFQRDPRKARTVRNVTSAHSGTLLYV